MVFWIIAGFLGSFIKGICGFGDAPIFSSILALGNDNISITPVLALLSFFTNAVVAFKERASLRKDIWLPMAPVMIALISTLIICGMIIMIMNLQPGSLLQSIHEILISAQDLSFVVRYAGSKNQ